MNAIAMVRVSAAPVIATTRVAQSMAGLDGQWAIVARQLLQPSCELAWIYEGTFGTTEAREFRSACDKGLIVKTQGRDANGNCVLYAKTAKYIPGLQNYARRGLTARPSVAITRAIRSA